MMHRQHRRTCSTTLLLLEKNALFLEHLDYLVLQSGVLVSQSAFLSSETGQRCIAVVLDSKLLDKRL